MATSDELAAMLAHELAEMDGMDEDSLFELRWSGGPCPEPLGDAWNMDYLPKGERLAAVVERQVRMLRLALAGLIDFWHEHGHHGDMQQAVSHAQLALEPLRWDALFLRHPWQRHPWQRDPWQRDPEQPPKEHGALEEAKDLAGHYMAQRDEERARMARAVQALGIAGQCIHAAANDQWQSFDAVADDFEEAVAEVMNGTGAVTVTPASMRQAVAQCEIEHSGDWCETCPTVDACRIRGACSPFLGKPRAP